MNELQCLKQLRYLLRARKWSGGSTPYVFSPRSVRVTIGPQEDALREMPPPLCLIRPDVAESDPKYDEQPDLVRATVILRLVASVMGDEVGENALLGANRVDGIYGSKNRGLFEIEEEMFGAVNLLNEIGGIKIAGREKGAVLAEVDPQLGYVCFRDYSFELWCTKNRFYHGPTRMVATGGVGSVALTWTLPPDRFDRNTMYLRRAAGATPPATVTDGTGVTLSGALATSVSDVIAAGTYSYSLFCGYDDFEDDTVRSYSAPVSKASVVVT